MPAMLFWRYQTGSITGMGRSWRLETRPVGGAHTIYMYPSTNVRHIPQ